AALGRRAALLAAEPAMIVTSVLVPAVQAIAARLRGAFAGAMALAKKAVSNAASFLLRVFTEIPGRARTALAPLGGKIWAVAKDAGSRMLQAIKDKGNDAIDWVRGLPGDRKSVV